MSATIHKFRRPGQCCVLCIHMRSTGKPGLWDAYVCAIIRDANGRPGQLSVVPGAGSHCAYYRARRDGA